MKVWEGQPTVMGRKGNFLLICYGSTFYIRHPFYLMKSKHAVTKCSTKLSTNNPTDTIQTDDDSTTSDSDDINGDKEVKSDREDKK